MNPRNPQTLAAPGVAAPVAPVTTAAGQLGLTNATQQGGILSVSVPASTNVPYQIQGSSFYVLAASAAIEIRVTGGQYNTFPPGTGMKLPNNGTFAQIELQNPNDYAVSVAVFVGFADFIDHRLILETGVTYPVAYPTSPIANVVSKIDIPDISGNVFNDINGNAWIAVQRLAIYISNVDPATSLVLEAKAPTPGTGVLVIPPNTTMFFPAAGDYALKIGAGAVNAIVSEIYNSISPNIPL